MLSVFLCFQSLRIRQTEVVELQPVQTAGSPGSVKKNEDDLSGDAAYGKGEPLIFLILGNIALVLRTFTLQTFLTSAPQSTLSIQAYHLKRTPLPLLFISPQGLNHAKRHRLEKPVAIIPQATSDRK